MTQNLRLIRSLHHTPSPRDARNGIISLVFVRPDIQGRGRVDERAGAGGGGGVSRSGIANLDIAKGR